MKKQVHTYTQSYDSVRAKPCKKSDIAFFPPSTIHSFPHLSFTFLFLIPQWNSLDSFCRRVG